MNILLISPSDPRDISAGGAQRSFFLKKSLEQLGTVYTTVPVPAPFLHKIDAENKIAHICGIKKFSLPWLADRYLSKYLPICALPVTLDVSVWHAWTGVKIDIVVCRYTKWAAYCRAWKIADLFIDIDDLPTEVQSNIYCRNGHNSRMGRLAIRLVETWANFVYRRAAGVWIANHNQLAQINLERKQWLMNIPNAPQTDTAVDDEPPRPMIFSVGLLLYEANYLGIDYFLEHVWTRLVQRYPTLRYCIVGKGLPESYQKKWLERYPNIDLLGYVESLEQVYRNSLFSVAPIYSGSGTCIKVLESMRFGRVCLCSAFAARGLEKYKFDGNGLMISQTADKMFEQACQLMDNPGVRREMQRRAPAMVSSVFCFDQFAGQVRQLITLPKVDR